MEESRETFDFTAVPAPSPETKPLVEEVVVPEPAPAPAPAPPPAPAPAPEPTPSPGIAYTTYPVFASPSPVRPFRLRFGLRNKM